MAAQGERGQEGLEMIESMAQDEMTVQDESTNMQVEHPPQPNAELEMGAGRRLLTAPPPPPSNSLPGPQRNRDRPRRFGFVGVG